MPLCFHKQLLPLPKQGSCCLHPRVGHPGHLSMGNHQPSQHWEDALVVTGFDAQHLFPLSPDNVFLFGSFCAHPLPSPPPTSAVQLPAMCSSRGGNLLVVLCPHCPCVDTDSGQLGRSSLSMHTMYLPYCRQGFSAARSPLPSSPSLYSRLCSQLQAAALMG